MKIIKRIAEQMYCFTELQFDSREEYNKEYPAFMNDYIVMQKTIKTIKDSQPPFEDDELAGKRKKV